jgi:hypothetical protein
MKNDLALLELSANVTLPENQQVLVAGLNGSMPIKSGTRVQVAGYGSTDSLGDTSAKQLMTVSLNVASQHTCKDANAIGVGSGQVDIENVFCTGLCP